MTRFLIRLSLALGLAAMLICTPLRASEGGQPTREIVVRGDFITLGDLFGAGAFTAAPEASQIAVAPAPLPGERLAIDLSRVREIAEGRGIVLPPLHAPQTVIVARESRAIGITEVEQALLEAMAARGLDGKLRIRFSSAEPVLNVPSEAAAKIAVESLDLDPVTGQFRAKLRAPADDLRATPVSVAGRAYSVAEIPVPVRPLRVGEVIAAQDLTWVELPSERLPQNVVTQMDALVGFAPRRDLREGAPLLSGDVKKPVMVEKNAVVAMVVRAPNMTLTAQGRALEAGAKGDSIRVLNTQTKRTVQARVLNAGEVVVQTASTTLAALP